LFLATHFYQNKYEYGEVWLNFTRQLSQNDTDPTKLRETILEAIVEIMDSTGGLMWQKDAGGNFSLAAAWNMQDSFSSDISAEDRFVRSLELEGSVLDVNAAASTLDSHADQDFPAWLLSLPRAWIVVPIMHRDELIAFLVLAESRSNASITWEDRELLRTVGSQAASYLALLQASEALSEVRQFEAFNRLSAFLVHDLKNVVAQLSLIVRNAERHRNNPEFISDAFNTIADSIAKMNRMLVNLRQDQAGFEKESSIELNDIIEELVARRGEMSPRPSFESTTDEAVVCGNRDQMLSVLEHIVQNAQEATQPDGTVVVRLSNSGDRALIEIADNGCGMDGDFVKSRLFRPFDTTKGKAGMGIGAYESRHIVSSMGGRMTVESKPGEGTTFRISLPCVDGGPQIA
jgi:putative PEP-CTERM system histidine kinase